MGVSPILTKMDLNGKTPRWRGLWAEIRTPSLDGFLFCRQAPEGPFVFILVGQELDKPASNEKGPSEEGP